jgi:hypothetical protein
MLRVLFISTAVAIVASVVLALWTPAHRTAEQPRVVAADAAVDDDDGRAPRPKWENAPAVAATFLKDSYRPGSVATLVLWHTESRVTMRIYRSGPERVVTRGNITMRGLPVTRLVGLGRRAAHAPIRVSVGDWPSGLYFAKLSTTDGRVGFAPFVVRPRRLGEHRVLVVLPTYTWQAYNFRDDDGDGKGDIWYANWNRHTASLARPFLARGVPPHFYRRSRRTSRRRMRRRRNARRRLRCRICRSRMPRRSRPTDSSRNSNARPLLRSVSRKRGRGRRTSAAISSRGRASSCGRRS